MLKRTFLFPMLLLLLLFNSNSWSQKGVATFGLQYRPIIPNRFIGTYRQDFNEGQLQSFVQQKMGHSFGGIIRRGLTNSISLETGINITYRNFDLNFAVPDSGHIATSEVGMVSYDLPLSCLVYIRLSDRWFINTSLGVAATIFPSNIYKPIIINPQESFLMEGAYKNKIQGAMLANVGFEFRSRKSGYFYLGTSYHLPFVPIITMAMAYEYDGGDEVSRSNVLGSYLTVDFRYFFHERPEARN